MSFKLSLNQESVEICYYWADKLPVAVANISESTIKLLETYNSLANDLGIHRKDFQIMLLKTEKSMLLAAESLEIVENDLRFVARKIEDYINRNTGSSGSDSPKIKTLNRGHFDE